MDAASPAPFQDGNTYFPAPELAEGAHISSLEAYEEMYRLSVDKPNAFWAENAAAFLDWHEPWDEVLVGDFTSDRIEWFKGGKLNVSYNCIDRHVKTWRRNKAALIWESDEGRTKTYTYQSLYHKVNKFANVLRSHGIGKGDRVAIYLPMIPELPIAMLACARIGAIHTVVFAGFSWQALRDRMNDCGCKMLITADEGIRGGRLTPLKSMADEALNEAPSVEKVVVVSRTHNHVNMEPGRDVWYHEEVRRDDIAPYAEIEWMDSEDPLFILYTSGSTGKPKGVFHTSAGYLLHASMSFKYVFDYHDDDVFFCTADIGWITGHSYIVYGPLSTGATGLMFEGTPNYPDFGRFWEIVEKHGVNQFYTAPTAIRSLMKAGTSWLEKYDISSLRVLGTVGEPINPEAWQWYHKHVGKGRLPIVDTWWQTETGGHMIAGISTAMPMKPGSAALPFFGVIPTILDDDMNPVAQGEDGKLFIERPWPGMLRGTWGDVENKRLRESYFPYGDHIYFSGDGARQDEDGYYWLLGRVDDVMSISGHRISTAEVESALVAHPSVAEAAVVGMPDEIKGEAIFAYVVLNDDWVDTEGIESILRGHVRNEIGPIATPSIILPVEDLPKTRSGKIMRRILRKIAAGDRDPSAFGDTSTLAEPDVVDSIIQSADARE